jgi:hypothetical protein
MPQLLNIFRRLSMLLLLSAYVALFSAQLSFRYDITSILHQSQIEALQNAKTLSHSFVTSCSKNNSHKVNIRLNKRYQKENIEFNLRFQSDLILPFSDKTNCFLSYNESIEQTFSSVNATRGPPMLII